MPQPLAISPSMRADIFQHARACASMSPPQEAAGVIAYDSSRKHSRYIACANAATRPQREFRIRRAELNKHAPIVAIVHSHPGGPAYPSCHDMQQQIATDLPWLIAVVATAGRPHISEEIVIWGDAAPDLDMTAGYRHGVSDCYSLIRGWYGRMAGLCLPDFARDWEWWQVGGDLYRQYFAEAGFRQLHPADYGGGDSESFAPQVGDIFLASLRSPVPNHAGIYVGDGLILHHLAGRKPVALTRLPTREPIERWRKFITTWLRHQSH